MFICLQNCRTNGQRDQFQSLLALLISKLQEEQIINDKKYLYWYLLGITNTMNQFTWIQSWDDIKLQIYSSDLNYIFITKDDESDTYYIYVKIY